MSRHIILSTFYPFRFLTPLLNCGYLSFYQSHLSKHISVCFTNNCIIPNLKFNQASLQPLHHIFLDHLSCPLLKKLLDFGPPPIILSPFYCALPNHILTFFLSRLDSRSHQCKHSLTYTLDSLADFPLHRSPLEKL